MKVLMFGWEFPPHISGGLGTASYGLTKGLAKNKVDIQFVVPKAYGDEDSDKARLIGANQVKVGAKRFNYIDEWRDITYLEVGSVIVPYASPAEFRKLMTKRLKKEKQPVVVQDDEYIDFSGSYSNNLLQEVGNYAFVASKIAEQYPHDIIHAHDWLTYSAGVAAQRASGKPLVVHVHATEFDRSGEHVNQQVYDIERMGMHHAHRVIAVSNLTRQRVIHQYGVNPDKVVTIYNAVEPTDKSFKRRINKRVDDKIVTFLRRITFQKGPEYFVEAARLVLEKNKHVRFVMAGSGDLWQQMIHRAAQLGISDRLHFPGFLRGADVDEMFAMSDVFVMPSVSEPFGIVPLEAMRSNVPVIVSKQSGVSEILQHAIKVDFWDTHAMADAIHGILNYPGLKKMFTQYSRNEVNQLKWEHAARQVKKEYQQLLAGATKTASPTAVS